MAGQPYGMQAMLKEGHEMHDEPVMKNIVAAKELSNICRSSMGPNGEGRAAPAHCMSHPRRGRIPAGTASVSLKPLKRIVHKISSLSRTPCSLQRCFQQQQHRALAPALAMYS